MKKIGITLAAMLAAFAMISCNKEVAPAQTEKQKIQFNFTVGDLTPETRAAKTGWVNGDKLNIWFDGHFENNPDLVLTYNGYSWVAGELRDDCELADGSDKKLVALYESQNDLSKYSLAKYSNGEYLKISYTESEKVDNNSSKTVVSPTSMMAACSTTYSLSEGKLTSELKAWGFNNPTSTSCEGIINGFQITIEGLPDGEYVLNCSTDNYVVFQVLKGVAIKSSSSVQLGGLSGEYYVHSQASGNKTVFYYMKATYYAESSSVATTFTLIPKKDGAFSSENALTYKVTIPTVTKAGSYQPVKIAYSKFQGND